MGSGLSLLPISILPYLSYELRGLGLLSRKRLDEGKAPLVAAIPELHRAADLGKQRIVLADADIQAGLDRCSTLPHDNRAAGDHLAAKGLHAQPLGIRVASVC